MACEPNDSNRGQSKNVSTFLSRLIDEQDPDVVVLIADTGLRFLPLVPDHLRVLAIRCQRLGSGGMLGEIKKTASASRTLRSIYHLFAPRINSASARVRRPKRSSVLLQEPASDIAVSTVLILDDAVDSGESMNSVAAQVKRCYPDAVQRRGAIYGSAIGSVSREAASANFMTDRVVSNWYVCPVRLGGITRTAPELTAYDVVAVDLDETLLNVNSFWVALNALRRSGPSGVLSSLLVLIRRLDGRPRMKAALERALMTRPTVVTSTVHTCVESADADLLQYVKKSGVHAMVLTAAIGLYARPLIHSLGFETMDASETSTRGDYVEITPDLKACILHNYRAMHQQRILLITDSETECLAASRAGFDCWFYARGSAPASSAGIDQINREALQPKNGG